MSIIQNTKHHFESYWQRYLFSIVLILVSIAGAALGVYSGGNVLLRAGVFFVVAGVLLAELLAIVGRTEPDDWDELGISMAFFRASVVNYIASLGIMLVGAMVPPNWWWIASRAAMGIFAIIALIYMGIEDYHAWRDMDRIGRIRAILLPILYVGAMFLVASIW